MSNLQILTFIHKHEMFVKHLLIPLSLRPLRRKGKETAKNRNFSKSMGQNSVKNCSIVPKTDFDLDNLFSMCNLSGSGKKMNEMDEQ